LSNLFYINPSTLDSDMKALGSALREMLKDKGKSLEIGFKLARRSKTRSQLAYYNILLRLLAKECGYSNIKMDCTIKNQLGYWEVINIDGKDEKVYRSKKDCTIEQAAIFVETIMGLCGEMNIRYMSPGQYYESVRLKT